jgi:hypothetical protein
VARTLEQGALTEHNVTGAIGRWWEKLLVEPLTRTSFSSPR